MSLLSVGITGSKDLWLRRPLTMRIGRPIQPDDFVGDKRTRVRALTAALDQAMRALLPGDPARPGFFQLVYGERWLRAAILAGLATVPCEIAEHTDAEMFEIGLAENIQRRDLLPLEEGAAFRLALDQRGYSIRSLAERIGKDKSYIQDRLAALGAPADVQQMVEARPDTLRAAKGDLEAALRCRA